MNDQQRGFLQLVTGPALASEKESGIPAGITIAQAILESGWGQSRLYLEANNPFGIKAGHGITDRYHVYTAPTKEFENDKWDVVHAGFQKFDSLQAAFLRHGALLRSQRYGLGPNVLETEPMALRCQMVAIALQEHGYATDPDYTDKLMTLVREFHLDEVMA